MEHSYYIQMKKNNNLQFLYILLPALYTFILGATVGLDFSSLGIILLYLITVVLFTTFFVFSVSNLLSGLTMICYFSIVFLACFLPIIGLFLSPYGEHSLSNIKTLVSMRPVVVSGLFIVLIIKISPLLTRKQWILLSLGFVSLFCSFLIGNISLVKRFSYLLNSFVPLFIGLTLLAACLKQVEKSSKTLVSFRTKKYVYFSFVIACICLLYGYSIELNYDIFRPDLASSYRAEHKGLISYGDYPASWKDKISSLKTIRYAGTFFDPIQFGYFCSFASFFCLSHRKREVKILGIFFLYSLYLSGSKGAVSFFIMSLFLTIWRRYIGYLFWQVAFCLSGFFIFISTILSTSGKIHFAGLIGGVFSIISSPIKNMVFGYGIGAGGNLSIDKNNSLSSNVSWLESGAESGFGVLIYQTGFFGVISFLLLLFYVFYSINTSRVLSGRSKSSLLAILISYFTCFLLQENLVNTSIMLMMFLVFTMFLEKKNEKCDFYVRS
jgi:hypothetical protein